MTRERLAQVAHNLVRNALAHTPSGTEVSVSTGVEGKMGYIQVSDNGPGIAPGEAARVFDRFYQGDPSRSAAGTGLGLAIVRAIAEALHGSGRGAPDPGRRGDPGGQGPAGRDARRRGRRGAGAGAGPLTAAALTRRGRRPRGPSPA